MKIAYISITTPTYNNVRAASALPYHLMLGGKNHQFKIFSFNTNFINEEERKKTEEALGTEISFLSRPKWIHWMFKLHLAFFRLFLKYPFQSYYRLNKQSLQEIKDWNPNFIWIYEEELMGLVEDFKGIATIMTMPDCASMYYHRLLSKRFATKRLLQVLRYSVAYYQYRRMEREMWRKDVKYHFVGKADADFFKEINPLANAIFLPHPIYGYAEKRTIKFHLPRIKILVAGRYDLYMKEACDDALRLFLDDNHFSNLYEITFLGKGWERWYNQLKQEGYSCQHIQFAPNYIEELIKHDIQLSPISVGTGTKGKVLDAFSNGLMVIGTPFALENIQVENGISCICYNTAEELKHYLEIIPSHIKDYELMAMKGRECVLNFHNKIEIVSQLFS